MDKDLFVVDSPNQTALVSAIPLQPCKNNLDRAKIRSKVQHTCTGDTISIQTTSVCEYHATLEDTRKAKKFESLCEGSNKKQKARVRFILNSRIRRKNECLHVHLYAYSYSLVAQQLDAGPEFRSQGAKSAFAGALSFFPE